MPRSSGLTSNANQEGRSFARQLGRRLAALSVKVVAPRQNTYFSTVSGRVTAGDVIAVGVYSAGDAESYACRASTEMGSLSAGAGA
jgi:hypothetical protein